MKTQLEDFFCEPGWDGPFFKKLQTNDTNDNRNNQDGPNIPKGLQKYLPPLDIPKVPHWVQVDAFIDLEPFAAHQVSYYFYSSKNERRFTNIGNWYGHTAHKSDYLVIQRHSDYREVFKWTLITQNTEYWDYLESSTRHLDKNTGTSITRCGPLFVDHPPTAFPEPTSGNKTAPPFPASTHISFPDWDESDHSEEGRVVLRLHKVRERDRTLVKRKKSQAQSLTCEVCNFDFNQAYGEDYIECHHRVPLSDLDDPAKTSLEDLALVCANCHRMLHRGTDHLDLQALKDRLRVTYSYND
jgi:hypothetical protein